jgi:hypothetical protein
MAPSCPHCKTKRNMTAQGPSQFVGNHSGVLLISCEYPETLPADNSEPAINPSTKPTPSHPPKPTWNTENCIVNPIVEFEGIKYSHVGTTIHVPGHFSANVRYQDRIWTRSPHKTYIRAFHTVTAPGAPYIMPPPPHHPTFHCYVQCLSE